MDGPKNLASGSKKIEYHYHFTFVALNFQLSKLLYK